MTESAGNLAEREFGDVDAQRFVEPQRRRGEKAEEHADGHDRDGRWNGMAEDERTHVSDPT
jgi:hypothetical protein